MSLKRDKWNLSRKPNVSQLEHGTPILVFSVTVCVLNNAMMFFSNIQLMRQGSRICLLGHQNPQGFLELPDSSPMPPTW